MNFDLSDEQKLLLDTVASFVKKQSPVSRHRALRDDATGWSREVWQKMGEYGWLALALPARPSLKETIALADPWRPWRGVAARLLWSYYRAVKQRDPAPLQAAP